MSNEKKEGSEKRTLIIRNAIEETLINLRTVRGVDEENRATLLEWRLQRGNSNILLACLPQRNKWIAKISRTTVRVRKDTVYKDLFLKFAQNSNKVVVELDEISMISARSILNGTDFGYLI